MEEVLFQIGIGALAGLFIAGAGYLKSYDQYGAKDKFDKSKFLKTVILGTLVGGTAAGSGMSPEGLIALPAYAGVTAFVENLLKRFFKRG